MSMSTNCRRQSRSVNCAAECAEPGGDEDVRGCGGRWCHVIEMMKPQNFCEMSGPFVMEPAPSLRRAMGSLNSKRPIHGRTFGNPSRVKPGNLPPKWRLIAAILSVSMLSSCGTVSKTVKVVDESGKPISGAVMYPGVTFFNPSSGKDGRLRVSSNFPVIIKDGFQPVIAYLGDKQYDEATLLKLPESVSEEENRKIRGRLAEESLKLSGE